MSEPCERCKGWGFTIPEGQCPDCSGTGRHCFDRPCDNCGGEGSQPVPFDMPCPDCGGSGHKEEGTVDDGNWDDPTLGEVAT